MKYLLDTNIFIRSKNELPVDIWPTFWLRISELIQTSRIFSSVKVKEEIERGNDELVHWMEANTTKDFYYQLDGGILTKYADTQNWALRNKVFTDAARQEFANAADAYLVATAASKGLTLVTHETSEPYCRRKVKIPDACMALGVKYCDLNTALREMGVTI